jgi:hypothetical protein
MLAVMIWMAGYSRIRTLRGNKRKRKAKAKVISLQRVTSYKLGDKKKSVSVRSSMGEVAAVGLMVGSYMIGSLDPLL